MRGRQRSTIVNILIKTYIKVWRLKRASPGNWRALPCNFPALVKFVHKSILESRMVRANTST